MYICTEHVLCLASAEHVYLIWAQVVPVCSQTTAAAGARQADVRAEHLSKQLKEQKAALSSKVKEADAMTQKLQAAQAAVADCQRRHALLRMSRIK